MDRLMCIVLESSGEPVEAQVNGVPVARLPAGGGRCCVAVHEYLMAGKNRLSMQIAPPPSGIAVATPSEPRLAQHALWARMRLLLQRAGRDAGDANARVLGELAWAVDGGTSFDAPTVVEHETELPVGFRRWRWLDAPVVAPGAAERRAVLTFVQRLAFDLSRGQADTLIAASPLRYEELAHAYQWSPEHPAQHVRAQVQALYEAHALNLVPPTSADLVLRPIAGGRLLECLTPSGMPVLNNRADMAEKPFQSWPLRVAMVDGKVTVLR